MKTKSTIFCFVLAAFANINSLCAQVNVQDSLALVDLYNSTNGPDWKNYTNWVTTNPASTWFGITVSNGRVTRIVLNANKLKGVPPSSIGNLINLVKLNLNHNQLSGSILTSIDKLTNLEYLNLFDNQLSGSIPSSIGNLVHLTALYLGENQFTGSIPSSIGNLVNLHVNLDLEYNQLTGNIPSSITNLKKLNYLWLNNNQLTGSIPSSIGNMTALAGLVLSDNKLSGPIPSSIKNLNLFTENEGWLHIERNSFTFAGMELVAQMFPDATYAPQKVMPVHQNGNTLSVSAGGTLSNNTYKWFKNGTLIATITADSVFHPSSSGTYQVRVKNSVATQLVLISNSINYSALNNAVIASAENSLPENNKTNSLRVYPNPARDILHVETNGMATFSLVNQSGKILLTRHINGKGIINVLGLPAGLYYLKNDETGKVEKVVIGE